MSWKSWSCAALVLVGLVAICLVPALRPVKARMTSQPVWFSPVSKDSITIALGDQESEVVRELALTIKRRGPGVTKREAFTLASVGHFRIGADAYEWQGDLLFIWDDSVHAYLIVKDGRLGKCFDSLQSKHLPFDPTGITLPEWQDALHNLALR